ncbi:TetR/AcrR family transcriptional regulator [Rhodococcus sp. NPDC058514]|uniref:TetR/AcrR family transcriptional regulator n=1 Tax=unclassified Rhodococcus (in: high G+C Gram-positive bacteria) TaxID=192944 RepID=UPI003658BF28
MSTARRDEILVHAAQLFCERGVAGTTVRDIADAVGILSGSLYHYFGSKDAIALEIVVTFLDDLNERYETTADPALSARERLSQMISQSFAAASDHPFATEIYQNEGWLSAQPPESRIAVAVGRAHDFWRSAIGLGVAEGELRDDIDPEHFHRMIRESVWSTVRLCRATLRASAEQLRHELIAVFLDGFASAGGAGRLAVPRQVDADADAVTAEPAGTEPEGVGGEGAGSGGDELADLRRDIRELKDAVRALQHGRD